VQAPEQDVPVGAKLFERQHDWGVQLGDRGYRQESLGHLVAPRRRVIVLARRLVAGWGPVVGERGSWQRSGLKGRCSASEELARIPGR
jgi:hypothetical protein